MLSIVLPVYNEEKTVRTLVEQVRALSLDKEIIIIDDGSTDATPELLLAYESGVPGVRVHRNLVNLGKGASVRIGFSLARGDILTIQDADLELDPLEYHQLIRPILSDDADVVFGSRFLGGQRKGDLLFYLGNQAISGLTNLLFDTGRARLTDVQTCYKLFRRDVIRSLDLRAARFEIEPELTAQVLLRGYRIKEFPISYEPRPTHEKKVRLEDGLFAAYTLITQRLRGVPRPAARGPRPVAPAPQQAAGAAHAHPHL